MDVMNHADHTRKRRIVNLLVLGRIASFREEEMLYVMRRPPNVGHVYVLVSIRNEMCMCVRGLPLVG